MGEKFIGYKFSSVVTEEFWLEKIRPENFGYQLLLAFKVEWILSNA